MERTRRWVIGAVLLAVMSGTLLSGCEASFNIGGDDTISKEEVAEKAHTELSKAFEARGRPPLPPVTCESDLEEEVGATTDCEAKGDFGKGQTGTMAITARVTSVEGDHGNIHFQTNGRIQK